MKKWFGILLALTLPFAGAAAQENTVVALPTVAPLEAVETAPAVDYTYAALAEYYEPGSNESAVDEQSPRMSAEERERTAALLKEYQAGTRPAETVLNKLENVTVGVYTLNPEDYLGETLFTLLPVTPLTDEEILELIDAFAQCGQTFDPEALSYQNCMRGGGIEVTRFIQNEENDRRTVLTDLYIRQGFTNEKPFTPLVSDDGLGIVTLNPDVYSGMEEFIFFPMRAMTDDELLGYVIYTETGDPTEYGNYAEYEKQLRLELSRLFGAPLSMTRYNEGTGRMGDSSVYYGDESVYFAGFNAPAGMTYWGYLDLDTKKLLSAYAYQEPAFQYSDLHMDPFDEKWLDIAKTTVVQLRDDSMPIANAESHGEISIQDGGYGVLIAVMMEDGSHYEMAISYQTEVADSWISYDVQTLDADQHYAIYE